MIDVPRVVLVGHDASATGAPLTALAFARWAAASGAADVEVLLDRGGPLAAGFEAIAPNHVRSRPRARSWPSPMPSAVRPRAAGPAGAA